MNRNSGHHSHTLGAWKLYIFAPRSQLNGNLFYGDCSAFGRSTDIDADKVLVVPLNVDDNAGNIRVVSGVYHENQNWVDDVHDTSIFEMTSVDDCILQVMVKGEGLFTWVSVQTFSRMATLQQAIKIAPQPSGKMLTYIDSWVL